MNREIGWNYLKQLFFQKTVRVCLKITNFASVTIHLFDSMRKTISMFVFLMAVFSCGSKKDLLEHMDEIKHTGETNPELALRMLDSIQAEVSGNDEYIQNKYHLLNIRLNDKAYIQPASDIMIRRLVDYFMEGGTEAEKQEVLYYAGSVYRDLNDTPKALEFFHQSKDVAADNPEGCDSLMLAKTFSNLTWLYYSVQDYDNALDMAKKEWTAFAGLRMENPRTLVHIGTAQLKKQDENGAAETFKKALRMIQKPKSDDIDEDLCSALLYQFSYLTMKEEAAVCRRMMVRFEKTMSYNADDYLALGEYYKLTGQQDSMVYCLNQVIDGRLSGEGVYDATKILFDYYDRKGDIVEANRYARWFVMVSDTLNLGGRQELAATVNNQYQYHRNQREEQRLRNENSRNKTLLLFVLLASSLMLTGGLLFFFYRKNRRLKEDVAMQNELLKLRKDKNALEMEISAQQSQIDTMKASVQEKVELVAHYQAEIERYDQDSAAKEKELKEKIKQNKSLIGMLNQMHFTVNNEDVVQKVRKAAVGQYTMKEKDWDAFCGAIDLLYPDYKDILAEKLGKFNHNQMLVCYLMRIGITPPQIQHLLNLPRTTVWRWTSRYASIINA